MSSPEQRFRVLHIDTYPDLLRFVERRVPAAEAEDVVATVFLTAWRRFDDLPADARPWLFAVARKTIANQTQGWLRRRALDVRMAAQDVSAEPGGSGAAAARIDLARAWRALSADDREVLALVAFDGLTSEQAAVVLDVRRSTFAMRLGRARQQLQKALAPARAPTQRVTDRAANRAWTGA
jgi:RNA polymerase sigma factor (sigma-70 family)